MAIYSYCKESVGEVLDEGANLKDRFRKMMDNFRNKSKKKRQDAKRYEVIPKDKIPKAEYDLDADISFMKNHDIPIPEGTDHFVKDPSKIETDVVKMLTECIDGFETYFNKLQKKKNNSDFMKYWNDDRYFDDIIAEAAKYADTYSCIGKGEDEDDKLFPCFFESIGGSKSYTQEQITRAQKVLMNNSRAYAEIQQHIFDKTYHIIDKVHKNQDKEAEVFRFYYGEYDTAAHFPKYTEEGYKEEAKAMVTYQKAIGQILFMESSIIDDIYTPVNDYIWIAIRLSKSAIDSFNSEVSKSKDE